MTRPWHARAVELEPREGHWADYAAWQEWMGQHCDERLPDGVGSVVEALDGVQLAHLYCAMCDLADGAADEAVIVEGVG